MNEREVPLSFPCGRDFRAMALADGGRLCAECRTVVRDLSSMSEDEARAVLSSGAGARLCIRYLYDADGRVVFAGDCDVSSAKIVPAYRLTARAKARIASAALLVAPLVLFEACGGAPGDPPVQNWQQQRTDAGPTTDDDAGDSGDAGTPTDDGGNAQRD